MKIKDFQRGYAIFASLICSSEPTGSILLTSFVVKKLLSKKLSTFLLAGAEGIEPSTSVLETDVMPLN
jgi:hypothetical protein